MGPSVCAAAAPPSAAPLSACVASSPCPWRGVVVPSPAPRPWPSARPPRPAAPSSRGAGWAGPTSPPPHGGEDRGDPAAARRLCLPVRRVAVKGAHWRPSPRRRREGRLRAARLPPVHEMRCVAPSGRKLGPAAKVDAQRGPLAPWFRRRHGALSGAGARVPRGNLDGDPMVLPGGLGVAKLPVRRVPAPDPLLAQRLLHFRSPNAVAPRAAQSRTCRSQSH
ncbi:hypothetical protein OCS_05999 [Ophiocordyceps sinensis CO18]|uniref:Uncharacterized protein n=1 Tax=Ophiocordyceps sinensis (strain Co18 / CGMCC 3.14243) TaxID=911162 RepID=T4ZYS2_OPHSC|nr:hypothetical protein OCS_05999 [Ophiocordyceps sinensis CO18]